MNESSNKKAIIVGMFIFLGLAFLVAGILIVGNVRETFKSKFKVVTLFDDVNGLQKGNNIWFSGVKVGTVSSLEFYGSSQVKVVMNVETKAQSYIRKDALVKISTDGLIGNKILVIYGGTNMSAEVNEGDTLRVEKTFSSEDMINTLQANNENFLAITKDFKVISGRLANGDGTVGKLMTDNTIYDNIAAATSSLQNASVRADQLVASLNKFTAGLNKEGTLANELVTDTTVFNSLKSTMAELQQIADTAAVFISDLKAAGQNPKSSVGVLLHDEEAGASLKATIKNLETSSQKLDEDLKAAQSSFLLRRYFKKKGE